jgi:hypothetical protein
MSEFDNFEERLRAMADEISRSVQRISEADLADLAERYGVDPDRARTFADTASRWLGNRLSGQGPRPDPGSAGPAPADPHPAQTPHEQSSRATGPHPLDLPTGRQGLALSALDSGRWTVRPGSNQLSGTGDGPPPSGAPDVVSELRARDWITIDGTLTLVGRHALARWCRTAVDPAPPPPQEDIPSTP